MCLLIKSICDLSFFYVYYILIYIGYRVIYPNFLIKLKQITNHWYLFSLIGKGELCHVSLRASLTFIKAISQHKKINKNWWKRKKDKFSFSNF